MLGVIEVKLSAPPPGPFSCGTCRRASRQDGGNGTCPRADYQRFVSVASHNCPSFEAVKPKVKRAPRSTTRLVATPAEQLSVFG